MIKLKDGTIVDGIIEEAMFEMSNTGHWHLGGFTKGHNSIPDGHLMTTSRVLNLLPCDVDEGNSFILAVTKHSTYALDTHTLHASIAEVEQILIDLMGEEICGDTMN